VADDSFCNRLNVLGIGAVMGQKDRHLDRMSALDEALRRMVRTCPVPREVRSVADLLAAQTLAERQFPQRENR
jgi:hypothetical protein